MIPSSVLIAPVMIVQTASRIFNFADGQGEDTLYLLPLADLLSHDDETPNAVVNLVGAEFHIIATEHIFKGEEVCLVLFVAGLQNPGAAAQVA